MGTRTLAVVGLLLAACASCGEAAAGGEGTHPIPTNPALRTPEERGVTAQRGTRPTSMDAPDAPPDPLLERARELFAEGVAAVDREDYATGLEKFGAAYAIAPRAPLLFNYAVCQEHLGDIQGALITYQHYLADGADQPEDQRQMVRDKIRALESQLGIER
jgi:tetratricopeptide (TPR) repeat protein